MRELSIEEQEEANHKLAPTKTGKEMKQKAKSEGLKNLKSTLEEKPLHGQYPHKLIKLMLTKRKPISGFVAQS